MRVIVRAIASAACNPATWPRVPAPSRLGIVGGGKMAEAMIGGAIEAGIKPEGIVVSDVVPARLDHLRKAFGVRTTPENEEAAAHGDLVILAVKPQLVNEALSSIKPALPASSMLVSIAAGSTMDTIVRLAGTHNVVRCMPNTPGVLVL